MSATPLRPIQRFAPGLPLPQAVVLPRPSIQRLTAQLLTEGLVAPHDMVRALAQHDTSRRHLADILLARGAVLPQPLYRSMARLWGVGLIDLAESPPDHRLVSQISHVRALRDGLLPWRQAGQTTVIVTAYPDVFAAHRPWLEEVFGPVAMALAPRHDLEKAILCLCGPQLAQAAETRVEPGESCRQLDSAALRKPAMIAAAAIAIFMLTAPKAFWLCTLTLALVAMFAFSALKLGALWHMFKRPAAADVAPIIMRLPVVSIMVAMYRESDIAHRLVARLGQLDYPRGLLDVLLVVEAEDHLTRQALEKADLPHWMRVVVVPDGSVKTKPRALNYALDHCRGSIIGIYDAEDAPEPAQIRKVVERFHQRGSEVACLQGVLDFYNPHSNWLARCFTVEYASWFRMFLPGIERMGLAVPLGGTTLFFRRPALEKLGGWDAQNVTEDADLGLRLARHGLRTELLDTVTFEEANCRSFPWVKQRSRWIKGYMMTYLSHMRDPLLLWRQLGGWRFIGFQVQFLGSVLQSLLAPLIWSFWIVAVGVPHPLATALPAALFSAIYVAMAAVQLLTIGFDIAGLRRTSHRMNPVWALTLSFYHPLATLAAYKALWELLTKPFYWDKTSHGIYGG